jgi:chaperonin GroEL
MNTILKDVIDGIDAKERIMSGVDKLANPVASSMGYRGRTVLIESPYGLPEPTQDGYKILQSIFLEDPVEAMACEIAKQASQRTVDFAGDSTTATIVLLQAFLRNSIEAVKNGKSAIDVKNEIEKSRDLILKYLDEISIPVTDKLIYDIAYTSSHSDDEIAKIVSEAFIKAGEYGAVSHLRSANDETHLEWIEGTLLESGYSSDLFVNNFADRTCEFANPFVVCTNIIFKTVRQIQPFLERSLKEQRPIVIIADWQDGQAKEIERLVIANKLEHKHPFVLVNLPSFGTKRRDLMNDLAVRCGTQLLSSLSGDDFAGRETAFMGTCEKIVIGKSDTIITPFKNDKIQSQVDSKIAELQIEEKASKNQLEKKDIKERVSKLHGGIAMVKVGSIIESELQEKIDRVDDAVCAVRSAKEEGVVAGGGVALFSASSILICNSDIASLSLVAPLNKILLNASVKSDAKIGKYPFGYDVKNFKEVNMIEVGIVDATKAIKHALTNAISASNTLLMSDHVITNKRNNG